MNTTKTNRFDTVTLNLNGTEVIVPFYPMGTIPMWCVEDYMQKDLQRALFTILKELKRTVQEDVLSFRLQAYNAPLRVSAGVPEGFYAKDAFENIVINENEGNKKSHDADGDRGYVHESTSSGLYWKYPTTTPPVWLKKFTEPIKEVFRDFDPTISDLKTEARDIKDLNDLMVEFRKSHEDPQTGIRTIMADAEDLARIQHEEVTGTDAQRLIGENGRRLKLIEFGMKAVRGHSWDNVDEGITWEVDSWYDQWIHRRAPIQETMPTFHKTKEGLLVTAEFKPLEDVDLTWLRQQIWDVKIPVFPAQPNTGLINFRKMGAVIADERREEKHRTWPGLYKALVDSGFLRAEERETPMGHITRYTLLNAAGAPVALRNVKRDGWTTVNHSFVVLPVLRIEHKFSIDRQSHGDIIRVMVDADEVVNTPEGWKYYETKWIDGVPHVITHNATRHEPVMRILQPEDILKEYLSSVYAFESEAQSARYRGGMFPLNKCPRTCQNIQRRLEEVVGRYGYMIHEYELEEIFADGTVKIEQKVNDWTISMARYCFMVDYNSLDLEKMVACVPKIIETVSILTDGKFLPALLGGDRGKFRYYQTYGLAKATANDGSKLTAGEKMSPVWAHKDTCPKRLGHIKSQLAPALPLGKCNIFICGGDTETQMFATPQGVQRQKVHNIYGPRLTSDPQDHDVVEFPKFDGSMEKAWVVGGRSTAEIGKILTQLGTKNQLAPLSHDITFQHEGETKFIHYVMNAQEFANKCALKAAMNHCICDIQVEIEGQVIWGKVIEVDCYRALSSSENTPPGLQFTNVSRVSALMISGALRNRTKNSSRTVDGFGEYDEAYVTTLQTAARTIRKLVMADLVGEVTSHSQRSK